MQLKSGLKMEWSRIFSEADIRQFAELSHDIGAHHIEVDNLGRLMVHGLLTATLPTKLGGDLNYIAQTMSFEFLRPVYANENVHCIGIVEEVLLKKLNTHVRFSFTVTNSKNKIVMRGISSGIIRLNP